MLEHFRCRFSQKDYDEINTRLIREAVDPGDENAEVNDTGSEDQAATDENAPETDDPDATTMKSGKLLIDATVTPADITYPTDLKLLNATREKLEHIIDLLHQPLIGKQRKPRTYRQKARKDFLAIIKRGGTLARVMAKLICTSVSVINIGLIVLNLDTRLRALLLCLLRRLAKGYLRHTGPTSAPWRYGVGHSPWFPSQTPYALRPVS